MFVYLIVFVIAILSILSEIAVVILNIVKAVKSKDYTKVKHNVITILCMSVAAASWIFNMGWYRFIMTFIAIPFIHAIIFFFVNNFAASYIKESKLLKVLAIFSYISYIIGYIFLPDGGDIGGLYVFFGLVHNDAIADISFDISGYGFMANTIILVLQLIMSIRAKKLETKKSANSDSVNAS